MGEIKYTYQKLIDGALAISRERSQMQDYDKKGLDGIETALSQFQSDYANKTTSTIMNMRDVGAADLTSQLDQYSATLSTAEAEMKKQEGQIANSFSGEAGK